SIQHAHGRNDPRTYERDPKTGVPWEWNFHAVGADQALNLTKGSRNVLVGVVDTGITPVPDLAGKIAGALWDPTTQTSAEDDSGHGTLIASIVAANVDDAVGMAGFCGACRVLAYKAVPLTTVVISNAIRRLTDAHVRIISLSLIGHEDSMLERDALNYALSAGVLVVAASGNSGASTVSFPASALRANAGGLAVGASDVDGKRASFSNWGARLSLVAPGTYRGGCSAGIIGAIPSIAISFDTG